ncbi:hypothetical protein ACIRG4_05910 [Streptomyces sp. NPDC102395]|uniref:hypothetical protein n=1 Tax=Streptomyces sp. NPDC102395 TaxID=3366168 RepID=UPI0037FA443C
MHRLVTTSRAAQTRQAPLAVLRAAVFAAVGTALGASAHRLLAEQRVPWTRGSIAAVALFALGLVGVRRPRRLVTVVAASVAAQSGLHLWLTLTPYDVPAPQGADSVMSGHAHGGHLHAAWYARPHDSVAMTAAHALVAALVAFLLHRADTACWTLARGLTAALDAVRAHLHTAAGLATAVTGQAGTGHRTPTAVPARDDRPPSAQPVLAHAVVRRGPPPTGAVLAN